MKSTGFQAPETAGSHEISILYDGCCFETVCTAYKSCVTMVGSRNPWKNNQTVKC